MNLSYAIFAIPFLFLSSTNFFNHNSSHILNPEKSKKDIQLPSPKIFLMFEGSNGKTREIELGKEQIEERSGGAYWIATSSSSQFNVGIGNPNVPELSAYPQAKITISIIGDYQFADTDPIKWEATSFDTQNKGGNDPSVVNGCSFEVKNISKKVKQMRCTGTGARGVINYRFIVTIKPAED